MVAGVANPIAIRLDILGLSIYLIMDLFAESDKLIDIGLRNAEISYQRSLLDQGKANAYFQKLLKDTPWQQDDIKVFGKIYKQPRLTALYSVSGKSYSYSGITMQPHPFSKSLLELKEIVESTSKETYNTVLLNLYRDGNDSNGWHSDDEKELGLNPVIASLSLGAKRRFRLRHKKDKSLTYTLELDHGSLLLMKGTTQHYWQHQLPKTKKVNDPRINLTFRNIL